MIDKKRRVSIDDSNRNIQAFLEYINIAPDNPIGGVIKNARREAERQHLKAHAYDPCDCGSGKKLKFCCGKID